MRIKKNINRGATITIVLAALFSACEVGPDEDISVDPSYSYTLIKDFDENISLSDMFISASQSSWAVAEEAVSYDPPNFYTRPVLLLTDNLWSTYESIYLPGNNANSIWFIDDQNGWIVGNNGLVLRSSDRGTSWVEYEISTEVDLRSIWFEDSLHGWIFGEKIFSTTNGGESWSEYSDIYYSGKIFIDDSTGFGMNGSKLYKTQDGGANWDLLYNFMNPKVYSFWTVDGEYFLGCGDLLMESTNGGIDWVIKDYNIKGVLRFIDENEGMVYWNNITWLTFNGGRSWNRVTAPYISFAKDIEYIGTRDIWLCGNNFIFHLEEDN